MVVDASGFMQLFQVKAGAPKINFSSSVSIERPQTRPAVLHSKPIQSFDNPQKLEALCPHGCPSLGQDVAGNPLLSDWGAGKNMNANQCARVARRPTPLHPDV